MKFSPDAPQWMALLVIDMQNGFCHREGTLGKSKYDISAEEAAVDRVADLVRATHDAGMPVLWSMQEHTEFDVARSRKRLKPHHAKLGYPTPCLRGTWDVELHEDLKALVGEHDRVFTKHRSSCFYNTNLEVELRMRGIDTLIVAGVATNYCVDSTIRDAYARDFDLYIVEDACATSWRELHDATMQTAGLFHGEVLSTAETVSALKELTTRNAAA